MTTVDAPLNQFADSLWQLLEPKVMSVYANAISKFAKTVTQKSDWLTKAEAIQLLNVGGTTLHHLCKKGVIKCSYPSPRTKLYSRKSIEEHLASRSI